MNEEQYKKLVEQIGKDAADKIANEMKGYDAKVQAHIKTLLEQGNYLTKEQYEEFQKAATDALTEVKGIAEKQGLSLTELAAKINTQDIASKSIAQVLKEDEAELKKIHAARSGVKEYMVSVNAKGEFVMQPIDTKAAGVTGTVDGLSGGGSTSSISQDINAATMLRIGGNAPIISQYRNTPWIFDLCNLITAQYTEGQPMAMWYEEIAKQGQPADVAEGDTKPLVQYAYKLRSAEYRKAAMLIGFTTEFSMDFPRLQSDILGKGRIDTINVMNTSILGRIKAAATAYNSGVTFKGTEGVPFANDFDVLAAMAAQVDNDTYGYLSNAGIMSTFKKYRMGITKDEMGGYLNRPEVLSNLSFVGNPDMAADDVIVGDLKQYNIILRGGFIVRIGYNGNDWAQNKFSVVMEQFYYDYISDIRKKAIVKGPDFAAVKEAIAA